MTKTLASLAYKFLQDPTLSPKTKKSYESTLLPFLNSTGGKFVKNFKRSDIQDYLNSLNHLSFRTHNRHQAIIHRLFNFAIEEEIISSNPCTLIKRRKAQADKGEFGSDELVRTLSKEQLDSLFPLIRRNPRLNALIWLLYETGARINEVLTLKVAQINTAQRLFRVKGKGNKERTCFYYKNAEIALKTYIEGDRERPSEYLFTERGAFDRLVKPLSYQNAYRDLKSAIDGVLILKNIRFHDLRHTYASERASIMPIEILRALLGHESIQTTLIYQHISSKVAESTAVDAFQKIYN